MALKLLKPTMENKEEALQFRKEFFDIGENVINGSEMLALIIQVAKDSGLTSLQLSVERANTPSVKTIVKNGGKLERSFEFEGEMADAYRIDLS